MSLESGVDHYTHYQARVVVHFPVDERGKAYENCEYCRYYSKYSGKCKLTEERILGADRYVGEECPLEEVEE